MVTLGALRRKKTCLFSITHMLSFSLALSNKKIFLFVRSNAQYKNNHFWCCGLLCLINSNEQLTDTDYDFFSYVTLKCLVHLIWQKQKKEWHNVMNMMTKRGANWLHGISIMSEIFTCVNTNFIYLFPWKKFQTLCTINRFFANLK